MEKDMKKKCNLLFLFIFMFTISTVYVDAVTKGKYICDEGYEIIGNGDSSFCCLKYKTVCEKNI